MGGDVWNEEVVEELKVKKPRKKKVAKKEVVTTQQGKKRATKEKSVVRKKRMETMGQLAKKKSFRSFSVSWFDSPKTNLGIFG